MADRTASVKLRADTAQYVAGMLQASLATDKVGQSATKAGVTADKGFSQAGTAADGFSKRIGLGSNAVMAFGAAAAVGIGYAVKTFADFEAQMSAVQAATGATGAEFEALSRAAIDLGADTKFSATEAAQGIEALAKAGVSTKDILGGGLKGALDLAAAGNMEVAAAAEIAATALTQFKLAGSDIPHVADLIAAAAGKAQGDVSDMGMALKQAGLVASQAGLSIEETTGALAAFASAGLIGSDAGTSFRSMLLHLAAPSKESAGLMHDLGINAYNAQGQFVGLESLAGQLKLQLGGLSQAQRDSALATIFGTDAVRAANVLYSQGAGGIARWRVEVDQAGYAAEQARIRTDNLRGDVERLRGVIDSLAVSAGSASSGPLRTLVQNLTDLVTAAQNAGEALKGPTEGIGSLFGWLEDHGGILFQTELEMDGLGKASGRLTDSTSQLSEKQKTIIEAQAEFQAQLDMTSSAAGGQVEALAALRDIQLEAANATDGARGASRNLEAAYDDATAAAEKNGATLDINTEAGRNNQEALDKIASSARDVAGKMSEAGESTAAIQGTVATARGNFLTLAGQMGLTADQANGLADKLGLVPGNYTANVTVLGAETAAAKVNGLQVVVDSLRGKTIYIDTVGRQFTSPSGGRSLQGGPTMARGGRVGVPHADGGPIGAMGDRFIIPNYAAGDDQVISAATGEYVVNAKATSRWLPWLQAMNSGAISRSGNGGGRNGGSVTLVNQGVIGSQMELQNWLTKSLDTLRRQGRAA